MYKNRIKYILLLLPCLFLLSCKKDWLDAKPSQDLVVPKTVKDFQALLDNTDLFNSNGAGLGEIASDNLSTDYNTLQAQYELDRDAFLWSDASFLNNAVTVLEWNSSYQKILNANIILEGLAKIEPASASDPAWKNAKGSALFYRAYSFYTSAQLFCRPFSEKAAVDPGIVIRLKPDVDEKSVRSSVANTHKQILSDLKAAAMLLPETPVYKTRPSLAAAYGLLARVYLSMRDYDNALIYADSCLRHYNKLLDYNTLNPSARRPFVRFNDDVIFQNSVAFYSFFTVAHVADDLYASYTEDDLRKVLFFTATKTFKNSYIGLTEPFNGLATDEILLIKAECLARKGQLTQAAESLNKLLETRWKKGSYKPFDFTDNNQALKIILQERRKELVMRGLRWTDLRRLNLEPEHQVIITRNLNGNTYTLLPDDKKYVFLIPQQEITTSGITQNLR